jgi:hypothetical protein
MEVWMRVRLIKMRIKGVEIDRRALREAFGCPGELVVMDVSDQGLRRPVKVARLVCDGKIQAELNDVHIVWLNEGRMTLNGFERQQNGARESVDYCQAWLCTLDDLPHN